MRKRRTFFLPLTLSVGLMLINLTLMIGWIVVLARQSSWGVLTIGTVAFALALSGLTFYMVLTLRERQVNRQQANFVDSVTHELKSPIASLRLYLETLQIRDLDGAKRNEFYDVMERELKRLDDLIEQLLTVASLDAIGQESQIQNVSLDKIIDECAELTSNRYRTQKECVFDLQLTPCTMSASPIVLEMIFGNLLDNSYKYGGQPPKIEVIMSHPKSKRIRVQIKDNGEGVPAELRKRIFKLFYRAGDELHRRQKGTGIGLFIVQTLVQKLHGKIKVLDRVDHRGSIFQIELPVAAGEK
jgi:two-component system, OmpR family, phosphate regulon sensor histidine kinase PhoR